MPGGDHVTPTDPDWADDLADASDEELAVAPTSLLGVRVDLRFRKRRPMQRQSELESSLRTSQDCLSS